MKKQSIARRWFEIISLLYMLIDLFYTTHLVPFIKRILKMTNTDTLLIGGIVIFTVMYYYITQKIFEKRRRQTETDLKKDITDTKKQIETMKNILIDEIRRSKIETINELKEYVDKQKEVDFNRRFLINIKNIRCLLNVYDYSLGKIFHKLTEQEKVDKNYLTEIEGIANRFVFLEDHFSKTIDLDSTREQLEMLIKEIEGLCHNFYNQKDVWQKNITNEIRQNIHIQIKEYDRLIGQLKLFYEIELNLVKPKFCSLDFLLWKDYV